MGLEDLPKYIYGADEQRLWLTLTADVQGNWLIGYSDTKGKWFEPYAIGDNKTIKEAVEKLHITLDKEKLRGGYGNNS